MTKEQEVIKYIETRIKICNENADICDDNDFDEEATYLREESYMLETVLNMLKENSEEIKNYKKRNKDLSNQILMLYKEQDNNAARIDKKNAEIEKYKYLYQKALDNTIEADRENIQLKKQIDLMAEEINETDRGYTDYCEMKIECDRNCKDCIKRYYERKSEE